MRSQMRMPAHVQKLKHKRKVACVKITVNSAIALVIYELSAYSVVFAIREAAVFKPLILCIIVIYVA